MLFGMDSIPDLFILSGNTGRLLNRNDYTGLPGTAVKKHPAEIGSSATISTFCHSEERSWKDPSLRYAPFRMTNRKRYAQDDRTECTTRCLSLINAEAPGNCTSFFQTVPHSTLADFFFSASTPMIFPSSLIISQYWTGSETSDPFFSFSRIFVMSPVSSS